MTSGVVRARCLTLIGFVLFAGCGDQPASTVEMRVAGDAPEDMPASGEVRLAHVKERSEHDPVAVTLDVSEHTLHRQDVFDLSVEFDIAPSYEIHDWRAAPPAFATRLALALPLGFEKIGPWNAPLTVRSQAPGDQSAYVGKATFMRQLRVGSEVEPGEHELVCSIGYQACDPRVCLRPVGTRLVVTVSVQP